MVVVLHNYHTKYAIYGKKKNNQHVLFLFYTGGTTEKILNKNWYFFTIYTYLRIPRFFFIRL